MKHFEDVWEEGEQIVAEYVEINEAFNPVDEVIAAAKEIDKEGLSLEEREEIMGKMLISLCFLSSKHMGLNTWRALRKATNDLKIEILDPDLESDL